MRSAEKKRLQSGVFNDCLYIYTAFVVLFVNVLMKICIFVCVCRHWQLKPDSQRKRGNKTAFALVCCSSDMLGNNVSTLTASFHSFIISLLFPIISLFETNSSFIHSLASGNQWLLSRWTKYDLNVSFLAAGLWGWKDRQSYFMSLSTVKINKDTHNPLVWEVWYSYYNQ